MKRSLPSFPAGAHGAGLFVLRVTFGVGLLAGGATNAVPDQLVHAAAWLIVGGLLAGALSRACCFGALPLLLWQIAHTTGSQALTGAFVTAVAVALILLGPGAYSVDGLHYGRRIYRLRP